MTSAYLFRRRRCFAVLSGLAAGSGAFALPTADLYYDFEPANVSGTTVSNLGSAGNAFDGVLTTLDRSTVNNRNTNTNFAGPGAFSPLISTDAKEGVGAFQPTNFTDSSAGAQDIGSLGGPMMIPAFDLGQKFTFSAWIKYGLNPNQSASNGKNPNPTNNSSGRLMSLANNFSEFPINGFKVFLNEFRHPVADPDNRDVRIEVGDAGGANGAGNRTVTTDPMDAGTPLDTVPDDGQYHHVAVVIDGTDPNTDNVLDYTIYADGTEYATFVVDSPADSAIYDADFAFQAINIGAQNNILEPFFGFGVIDEVKFFADTVLSATEVAELAGLAGVTGDYNANGLVEQGDLNQVLNNWGLSFDAVAAAWVNQRPTEGIVDQAELNAVLNNWGADAAPDLRGVAVPEPAAVGVLAILVSAGRWRRPA